MNRHDGPEDQSLGDRCMLGATPDFNGFRRIVQGEDAIAHLLLQIELLAEGALQVGSEFLDKGEHLLLDAVSDLVDQIVG
jgi:hypothetical protein